MHALPSIRRAFSRAPPSGVVHLLDRHGEAVLTPSNKNVHRMHTPCFPPGGGQAVALSLFLQRVPRSVTVVVVTPLIGDHVHVEQWQLNQAVQRMGKSARE